MKQVPRVPSFFPVIVLLAAVVLAARGPGRTTTGARPDQRTGQPTADRARTRKMIWFTPGPGTPDMRALFEPGAPWRHAWSRVSVIKFYQGHVQEPTPSYFLPNDFRGLAGVDAFRRITQVWHKQIGIGVGVVKAQYCSTNGVEEQNAIRETLTSMWLVETAGGHVNYLAMDEPFYAGVTEAECGAPGLDAAADRVVNYIKAVKSVHPDVIIGLIEPYPAFSASRLAQLLETMRARGIVFHFLHLDAGLDVMKAGALANVPSDWRYLSSYCATLGTRFGVIVNGDNGDSAALYSAGVMLRLQTLKQTFGNWANMPDDIIFQSWAVNSAGQKVVPPNLPEATPNTATELIDRGLRFLGAPDSVR